ncbi:transcriptional regulator, partial [Clostridioides difficile]
VIELSNLYSISLDVLLKGDEKMIEHLEESTNVVKSNQKMIWAIIVNIIVVALLITLNMFIPDNRYFLVGIFCLMVITSSALLYQIIKKF